MLAAIPVWVAWMAVAVVAVYIYGAHPLTRARYAHIPGPPKRWLTGNIREIFAAGMPEAYKRWAALYGPVFTVNFGAAPAVVFSDPATIKAVQLSQHTRPQIMSPVDLTLSPRAAAFFKANMLVTKDRGFHRDAKAAFLHVMRRDYELAYAPIFLDAADRLADRLAACADARAEVDVFRALGALTLEGVLRATQGLFLDVQGTAALTDGRGEPVACLAGPIPPSGPTRVRDPDTGGDSHPDTSDEAAELLEAARVMFNSPGRASRYFMLAQALPALARPAVKALATALPFLDPSLVKLNWARALTQATALGVIRDARAAAEMRACADCTGRRASSPGGGASASPSPPGTPSATGEGAGGVTSESDGDAPSAHAWQQHPLVRMRRRSEEAEAFEAEVAAERAAKKAAGLAPTTSASRRKLAAQPGGFVTHMITATKADGSLFTDVECAQQLNTAVLAGYETTATALSQTIYYTAATPGTWDRLVAEVEAVLGGRDPAPGDLGEDALPYLCACLREALRLAPPGAATIRQAAVDLEVHGYKIPKGTALHCAVYTAHRDPGVWGPDAEAFNPDRWCDPKRPVPDAFFAFGGGSLMCAGQRFALEEAKMTLVRLAQRGLSFDLCPGQIPLEMHAPLTFGPKKGVFVVPRVDARKAAADLAHRVAAVGGGNAAAGPPVDAACTVGTA